jgi:hypothetical protein
MKRKFVAIFACAALLSGCGGDGGTNGNQNNNNACPNGHEREGPACAPVFDECPGPAEIALLGGGCQQVGVTQCATGFASDGQGGCDPILPQDPCPDGTMELLGETECQPVGVQFCAQGFYPNGTGGCEPFLPPDPCPADTMEVIGHTACQPISDCGTGTWGNITTDATTIYVDAGYGGGNSDGSDASPFTTIADALAVANPGGQIAVAAGQYTERLTINQPLHIEGRCAEQVVIQGTNFMGQDRPPITINPGGSGTVIRGVTLTGDAEGLAVNGAQNITVQETRVMGAGYIGVVLYNQASGRLIRSLVHQSEVIGIHCEGCTLELTESVVRDTQTDAQGDYGYGISAVCDPSLDICGSVTVQSSVVQANRSVGLTATGTDVSVIGSVVRDTLPDGAGTGGAGIQVRRDTDKEISGTLTVEDSIIEANLGAGMIAQGVYTAVTDTVVRDTDESGDNPGRGIHVQCNPQDAFCGTLAVTHSVVENNLDIGIGIFGPDAAISYTIVRGTGPQSNGEAAAGIVSGCDEIVNRCSTTTIEYSLVYFNTRAGIVSGGAETAVVSSVIRDNQATPASEDGMGIHAQCEENHGVCGSLNVQGCLVELNRSEGIATYGVNGTIVSTVVRDTLAQPSDGYWGRGIHTQCDIPMEICGDLTIEGCVVERSRDEGIFIGGGNAHIDSTVVRDTYGQEIDGMFGRGIGIQCMPDMDCGSITVANCLVDGNRELGIYVSCAEATVRSTVIRDTLPQESDDGYGRGIHIQYDPDFGSCSTASVESSLLSGNRETSIGVFGQNTVVIGTTVRDSVPRTDGSAGRGINAQCADDASVCGTLTVVESVVRSSLNLGLFISGVPATIRSSAILDTRPNDQGGWANEYGQGIFSTCDERWVSCGALQVISSRVESSYSAGMAVKGVAGSIESSVVRQVLPQSSDDRFGYGIQVEGEPDDLPAFDVTDCWVQNANLAGILYVSAVGVISGSTVAGGQYAVAANVGSSPEIGSNNDLTGTSQNGLFWGSCTPSPAPPPAVPVF